MMRVTRVDGVDAFAAMAAEWNDMVVREGLGPAHRTEWLETLYQVSGDDRLLTVTRAEEDGKAVGFAATIVINGRWSRVPVRQLTPLSLLNQLHGTQFVTAHEDKRSIVRALVEYVTKSVGPWDLWIVYLQTDEPQAKAMEGVLTSLNYHFTRRAAEASPYLSLPNSWDQLQAGLQPRFRTSLRSRERSLRSKGTVQLTLYRECADVPQALEIIRNIEIQSWKQKSGLPITHPRHWNFYQHYAHKAAAHGRLIIAVLELNGVPLAFDYGVLDQGVYHLLQTSYVENRNDDYPGFVLRKLVIEWLISERVAEIDFGGGDTEWKSKWTRKARFHTEYVIYGKTVRGNAIWFLCAAKLWWRAIWAWAAGRET